LNDITLTSSKGFGHYFLCLIWSADEIQSAFSILLLGGLIASFSLSFHSIHVPSFASFPMTSFLAAVWKKEALAMDCMDIFLWDHRNLSSNEISAVHRTMLIRSLSIS
jgi:hypothetical protein